MTSSSVIVDLPQEMDRRVAMLVQMAGGYSSRIYLSYLNKRVNAKSIMGMMTMSLGNGDTVTVEADGPDEADAVAAISKYLSQQ